LLSTLRKAVRALGGDLQLVAAFPDRPPVVLSGIATTDPSEKGQAKRKLKGIWKGKVSSALTLKRKSGSSGRSSESSFEKGESASASGNGQTVY
jgi:hypothetical protein